MSRPHCLKPDACDAIGAKPGQTHCRVCNIKAMWRDPAFRAKRAKSNAATLAKLRLDPAFREREAQRARENGAGVLASGKMHTPDRVAQRAATYSRNKMAWCPPEWRDEYFRLLKNKHLPAAEARAVIEAHIDTEQKAARRAIAEFDAKQRARHARQKAQAY